MRLRLPVRPRLILRSAFLLLLFGFVGYVLLFTDLAPNDIQEAERALGLFGIWPPVTAIALQGDTAWIPHVRAAPALPNDLTSTVFAAVSTVALAAGTYTLLCDIHPGMTGELVAN